MKFLRLNLFILFLLLITSFCNGQVINWPTQYLLPNPVAGGILYSSSSAWLPLAAGTSGQVLTSGGAGAPTWGSGGGSGITSLNSQTGATQIFSNDANIIITSSGNTHALGWASTLSLARGGSGASLSAANGGVIYSSASAMAVLPAGTSGQILSSGGAGVPSWLSVVPIAQGGTNNGSLGPVAGGVVYTDASKEVVLPAGTSGQILISAGAAPPTWGSGGGGSTPEFFASGDITDDDTETNSGGFISFANANNDISITPAAGGTFKVYAFCPLEYYTANASNPTFRIHNTSGSATILTEDQATMNLSNAAFVASPDVFLISAMALQSTYTLSTGVTYHFKIQTNVASGQNVKLTGANAPFHIYGERVGN